MKLQHSSLALTLRLNRSPSSGPSCLTKGFRDYITSRFNYYLFNNKVSNLMMIEYRLIDLI